MPLAKNGITLGGDRNIKCHRGVWDPANHPEGEIFHDRRAEISKDRGEKSQEPCLLFYGYRPGMAFGTAIKSQALADAQREAAEDRKLTRDEAKKDRKQTKWALCVAIGTLIVTLVALVVSIATSAFTLIWDRYKFYNPNAPVEKSAAPEKPAPAPTMSPAKASPK